MKKIFSSLREKGQSIVEFAVVVPAFLYLFFMIIYGGMMISDYIALKHVAGTAARVTNLNAGTEATASISDDNKTVLKNHTTLLICKDMDLTPEVLKYTSGDEGGFISVTASAKIDNDKLPFLIKGWFTDLSSVSAPEYIKIQ